MCNIKFLLICRKAKRTKMGVSLCNGCKLILQCSPMCCSKTHHCQTLDRSSTPFYSAPTQKAASTHGTPCMKRVNVEYLVRNAAEHVQQQDPLLPDGRHIKYTLLLRPDTEIRQYTRYYVYEACKYRVFGSECSKMCSSKGQTIRK